MSIETSVRVDFRELFVKTMLSIFILLTAILLIKNNLLKPTILTLQLYSLTISRDILATHDSFINFVINFRLVEIIVFTILTTLFFIDYLDRRKCVIIVLTKIAFIAILLFNQIIVKNPYPTIPSLRKYTSLEIFTLEFMGFLLLLVFLIIDLTILILTINSVKKIIRINNIVKNTLVCLTIIYLLTIITRDYVVAYISLYMAFYTVTTSALVGK